MSAKYIIELLDWGTKASVFMKALPPGRRRSQQEKATRLRSGFALFLRTGA
jgi:hypothetical protein